MISLSLARSQDPRHQKAFAPSGDLPLDAFARALTTNIWSPIIWKGGIRTKSHFESAAYYALDFDGGTSLAEMVSFCRDLGLAHVIGTTKSHGKEKIAPSGKLTPPCDRFRVVLKAESACTSSELYRYNLAIAAERFRCDDACTDAARFFYPCQEIVSKAAGKLVAWLPFDEDYVPETVRHDRRRLRNKELGRLGILPPWAARILAGEEIIETERHKTVLRIGILLGELGWPTDDTMKRLSSLPLGRHVGATELKRHLDNGYRIGSSHG